MPVTPIRAELIGSRRCEALGIAVEAYTPVLAMCRELVGRGHNPARPLQVYRGEVLCLTVSSIGWGAQYVVRDAGLDRRQAIGQSGPTDSPAAE